MTRGLPLLATLALVLVACEQPETPSSNVCFDEHVVPLTERDCSICHDGGEFGVELDGRARDYTSLDRYIVPYAPDRSPLLDWAAGHGEHPIVWGRRSAEYATVAAWIYEGATEACLDRALYGDCRDAADCRDVACLCGDLTVSSGAACYVNPETGLGTCASDGICSIRSFGLCAIPMSGDLTDATVSFADQIVPAIAADCARCHHDGSIAAVLHGDADDYEVVRSYVDPAAPDAEESFLWWAAGGNDHPAVWWPGSAKNQLFRAWVVTGAEDN